MFFGEHIIGASSIRESVIKCICFKYLEISKWKWKLCASNKKLWCLITCMSAKARSISDAANKNGPRKAKSCPLLTAQNVYAVRLTTTTVVRITASITIFPVATKMYKVAPNWLLQNTSQKDKNSSIYTWIILMCSHVPLRPLKMVRFLFFSYNLGMANAKWYSRVLTTQQLHSLLHLFLLVERRKWRIDRDIWIPIRYLCHLYY